MVLVPKLRLGTQVTKLRFEVLEGNRFTRLRADAKQSFVTCVPEQSLGTRKRRLEFGTVFKGRKAA